MTRRDFLVATGGGAAGFVGGKLLAQKRAVRPPALKATAGDPLPPLSGIIEQIGLPVPGGASSPLWLSGTNGAGGKWSATIYPWHPGAQITWNTGPVQPWELLGNLGTFRANVVCWPLAELDGAALRADFVAL